MLIWLAAEHVHTSAVSKVLDSEMPKVDGKPASSIDDAARLIGCDCWLPPMFGPPAVNDAPGPGPEAQPASKRARGKQPASRGKQPASTTNKYAQKHMAYLGSNIAAEPPSKKADSVGKVGVLCPALPYLPYLP
jgi:hypothetical protein